MKKEVKDDIINNDYNELEINNALLSEKELEEIFSCTDLTKKINPKLINCKNWSKPGIASY